jgi:predicted lipoprotein with Yx(FWY)xxD motif
MPEGITVRQTRQGPVLATAAGMTLYKTLPMEGSWALAAGQANANGACAYQCPSEWPAAVAPDDAKPVGDFSIVAGVQGVRQWTYKGVPLLTFKYDREPGDTLGDDTFAFNGPRRPVGEAAWLESEVPLAEPPPVPEPTALLPPGIRVQRIDGGSRVFAASDGRTLYAAPPGTDPCGRGCADRTPLTAAGFARPVGEWTVIERPDGGRVWAHKGRPVFTFAGDRGARDVEGQTDGWQAVQEYAAPLPAEVALGTTESGTVFVEKASGRTLYYQGFAPRPYEFLGFNHPGRRFGTVNCYNECADEFPPLLATAAARPVGEWWIVTRLDGGRQWAYRGVPVYLYAKDQPGRHLASYRDHRWAVLKAD